LVKKILIISAIVSLVAGIIFIIEIISKLKLFNVLFNLEIPDILLLILIIAIFISLVFINKKFQGLSPKKIKEMLADNERITNHNKSIIESVNNIIAVNKKLKTEIEKTKEEFLQMLTKSKNETKDEEKLEPNDEIIFILDVLASQSDRTLEQDYLWEMYHSKFKEKRQADFQIIINDLDTNELIQETEYGEFEEIAWMILPLGIKYLKKNR